MLPPTKNTNTLLPTPPPPHQLDGGSVAIVVWFEGPLGGQTKVLGLLVGQFGQLHSEFIQVGSCDLLVQLWTHREKQLLLAPSRRAEVTYFTVRLQLVKSQQDSGQFLLLKLKL